MGANGEQQTIGQPHGLAHDIEVAIGEGVERARKKRYARHGRGLTRPPPDRKFRISSRPIHSQIPAGI
jgi:hypothetical protein